jgi:chromosome segregation ATPase
MIDAEDRLNAVADVLAKMRMIELAAQVREVAAELARLRHENKRLRADSEQLQRMRASLADDLRQVRNEIERLRM